MRGLTRNGTITGDSERSAVALPHLESMLRTRMGVDAGNDPVQFWRHVGAALDGRTADRVSALLREVQAAWVEAVAILVSKLAEDGQRGWLFHGVVADPA